MRKRMSPRFPLLFVLLLAELFELKLVLSRKAVNTVKDSPFINIDTGKISASGNVHRANDRGQLILTKMRGYQYWINL